MNGVSVVQPANVANTTPSLWRLQWLLALLRRVSYPRGRCHIRLRVPLWLYGSRNHGGFGVVVVVIQRVLGIGRRRVPSGICQSSGGRGRCRRVAFVPAGIASGNGTRTGPPPAVGAGAHSALRVDDPPAVNQPLLRRRQSRHGLDLVVQGGDAIFGIDLNGEVRFRRVGCRVHRSVQIVGVGDVRFENGGGAGGNVVGGGGQGRSRFGRRRVGIGGEARCPRSGCGDGGWGGGSGGRC
mmetsp:Transcript_27460/g.57691  ORF Transcript_27460/g.57691 Transcript_27460/m.57691 type:complete len:239 (-) Transcript_27460:156-872(-)